MIEASAIWTRDDRFIGQASSGHALVVDAGTKNSASTPMELVLIALCACTGSDVAGILRKKREPFSSLEVRAVADRADTFPKVYTEIRLIYRVVGPVSPKAMEDAVHLSKEKYCSVSAMLEHTARIDFEIEYAENDK